MMFQRFLSICLMAFALVRVHAQEISRYDYWLDADMSTRKTISGNNTNIAIDLPVEGLETGLHYLNFRVQNTDKEWSNLHRYLFYIPELASAEATWAGYECWMDDDMTTFVRKKTTESALNFSFDIGYLSTGLHYFNFRNFNSAGEYGNLHRSLFYLPEINAGGEIVEVEYEYWFDDDKDNAVSGVSGIGELVLIIDIDHLEYGEHTFHFQARTPKGIWGEVFMTTFELTATTGVENANTQKESTPSVIYRTDGQPTPALRRGVNIVRMGDGTVKKIIVK